MIESMTGFGSGEFSSDGFRAIAEIRSVNNRFSEITLKLPRQFSSKELDAKELIRAKVKRGKITAQVQFERGKDADAPIRIKEDMAKAYSDLLFSLREMSGIKEPVQLDHLLKFSDIFEPITNQSDELEKEWDIIHKALDRAIDSLRDMRCKEGKELFEDFQTRISMINSHLIEIESLSKNSIEETKNKLRQKIREVLEDESKISRERLELEVVLIADKLDITEECVRFRSHNKYFLDALENDENDAGKKLNFLLQEQVREANTIASKSQNSEISQKIVLIKEELERLREQVQNVQ
jgi:uncharacterized protein (TIGR00255 family)